jgi:hypothetical protein
MENFQGWSELFGLIEEDIVYQKRVLSAVSGAILPLVALGFIKSLVDYIKPQTESLVKEEVKIEEPQTEAKEEKFSYTAEELEESKEWDVTLEDGLEEEPIVEETKERDEDHELDLVLNEIVEDLEIPSVEETNTPSDFIGGYYGDILIDGNGPLVQTEESQVLPVNSNKRGVPQIDSSSKVSISPTRL